MTTPSDAELREAIIKILGLEHTAQNQLVPSNFEDFQSDWSFTVDELLTLVTTAAKSDNQSQTEAVENATRQLLTELIAEKRLLSELTTIDKTGAFKVIAAVPVETIKLKLATLSK